MTVTVRLGGAEVAKWLANRGPAWRGSGLPTGVIARATNVPVIRDLNDTLDVAVLDYAEVEVAVLYLDPPRAAAVKVALDVVNDATNGLVDREDVDVAVELKARR